jgi:hypothetical protein
MAQMEGMDKFLVRILSERIGMVEEIVYLKRKVNVMENMMKLKTEIITSQTPLVVEEPPLDTTQPPLTLVPKKKRGRPVGSTTKKTTPTLPHA